MGGLLGGPKGMLAPLSNYWGGGPGPPGPPSSYAYDSKTLHNESANSKGSDQPAHACSQDRTFAIRKQHILNKYRTVTSNLDFKI